MQKYCERERWRERDWEGRRRLEMLHFKKANLVKALGICDTSVTPHCSVSQRYGKRFVSDNLLVYRDAWKSVKKKKTLKKLNSQYYQNKEKVCFFLTSAIWYVTPWISLRNNYKTIEHTLAKWLNVLFKQMQKNSTFSGRFYNIIDMNQIN